MAEIATWICWGVVIADVGRWSGGRSTPRRAVSRKASGSGALWRLGAVVAVIVVIRLAGHDLAQGHGSLVVDRASRPRAPGRLDGLHDLGSRSGSARCGRPRRTGSGASHELRTDGPYAITRHPIYTGLLGMLLGTVLLNGPGVSLALLAVGAAFLAIGIPIEERLIEHNLPQEDRPLPRARPPPPSRPPTAAAIALGDTIPSWWGHQMKWV